MKATLANRLDALESANPEGEEHWIFKWSSWDEEVVLDHYGRDKIGPADKVNFIVWRDDHLERPAPYPGGYFDQDGRWAAILKARGIEQ